jgi:hypothetical protein
VCRDVDARNRDVVFEAPRHRLEELVRAAERAIAVVDVLNDDPHAVHVDDIRQMDVLALHLQVNTVQMLLAGHDTSLDADVAQCLGEAALDLAQ